MAQDIMILMRSTPLRGPLEGVGPENQDFLGPEMAAAPHPTQTNTTYIVQALYAEQFRNQ